jgi:hypothetical protein
MPLTFVTTFQRALLTRHVGLNRCNRLSDRKALSLTSVHSRRRRTSLLPLQVNSLQAGTRLLRTRRRRMAIDSDRKVAFPAGLLVRSQAARQEGLACRRVHMAMERPHQDGVLQANSTGLQDHSLGKAPLAHPANSHLNKIRTRTNHRRVPRVRRLVPPDKRTTFPMLNLRSLRRMVPPSRNPRNKNPTRSLQEPLPHPLPQSSPLLLLLTQNLLSQQPLLLLHSLHSLLGHKRQHQQDPKAAVSPPPCLLSALVRGTSHPKLNLLLPQLQYKVSQARIPPKTTTTQPRLRLPR